MNKTKETKKFLYKLSYNPDEFINEQNNNNSIIMDFDLLLFSFLDKLQSKKYLYDCFLFGKSDNDDDDNESYGYEKKCMCKYLTWDLFTETLQYEINYDSPVIILLRNISKIPKEKCFHGMTKEILFSYLNNLLKYKSQKGYNWTVYYN